LGTQRRGGMVGGLGDAAPCVLPQFCGEECFDAKGPPQNTQGIRPPLHRRQWRCSSLKYCSMFDSSCLTGVAPRRPRCTWLFCGGPLAPAAKYPGHSATAASAPVALLVAQILQYVRLLVPYWRRASAPSVHLVVLRRALSQLASAVPAECSPQLSRRPSYPGAMVRRLTYRLLLCVRSNPVQKTLEQLTLGLIVERGVEHQALSVGQLNAWFIGAGEV